MKVNEDFIAKPDNSHFPACCNRMAQINKFSKRLLIFVICSSGMMMLLQLFGIKLSAISLIPSLFGCTTSALYLIVQSLELIGTIVLAAMGFGRYKICQVMLFGLYILMIFGCIIGGLIGLNSIPFAIAVIGAFIAFPSVSCYYDHKVLVDVEGYPYFNALISDQGDGEYKSMHAAPKPKTAENGAVSPASSDMLDIPEIPKSELSDMYDAPPVDLRKETPKPSDDDDGLVDL